MSALDRLEDWLTDPVTRKTVTALAEETLDALLDLLHECTSVRFRRVAP